MTWFVKNLGDAMLATDALHEAQALFSKRYQRDGAPTDMAIFSRHESEGRLHCELKLYFSPASINVAQALGARPCGKPDKNDLSLLAGSKEAWALFQLPDEKL